MDTLLLGYPLGWNDVVGVGESILAIEFDGVKVNSEAQTAQNSKTSSREGGKSGSGSGIGEYLWGLGACLQTPNTNSAPTSVAACGPPVHLGRRDEVGH
jgi:hypothetical protein